MRALDIQYMWQCLPEIMKGIPYALLIAVVALIFGSILGLVTALIRIFKLPVLKQISAIYIAIIRGTPLMVQILVTYYGIPQLLEWVNYKWGTNVSINSIPAIYFMFFCFSLYTGSYMSEMFRSCIQAVDPGQLEACYSVGMTTNQGLIRVVLPQAFSTALPNIGNQFIGLIKDASLAFAVAIPEILGRAKIVAGRSSKFLEAYIVAAIIYFVICTICQFALDYIEKRNGKYTRRK